MGDDKNPTPLSSSGPIVSVQKMGLSDGRTDYFVSIRVGDRQVHPHVFREEFKAAYHVALYNWLLNGSGEEPDILAFDEDDWPARVEEVNASGDGEAAIIECLTAGKAFVFDPSTNFMHADDGTVEGGIRYVPEDSPISNPGPVAWMHPTADWAHVSYDKVDVHCLNVGPRPVPLYLHPTTPSTSLRVTGFRGNPLRVVLSSGDEATISQKLVDAFASPSPFERHPDDVAVDQFAVAMKAKLAMKRDQGLGGWDDPKQCHIDYLMQLLREQLQSRAVIDPVDIGNLAMMIHNRPETPSHGR